MWDLSGPGLEPVSPALAGGFLTTAPPGKSSQVTLIQNSQHSTLAYFGVASHKPHHLIVSFGITEPFLIFPVFAVTGSWIRLNQTQVKHFFARIFLG